VTSAIYGFHPSKRLRYIRPTRPPGLCAQRLSTPSLKNTLIYKQKSERFRAAFIRNLTFTSTPLCHHDFCEVQIRVDIPKVCKLPPVSSHLPADKQRYMDEGASLTLFAFLIVIDRKLLIASSFVHYDTTKNIKHVRSAHHHSFALQVTLWQHDCRG
jgi:hypothetical protein